MYKSAVFQEMEKHTVVLLKLLNKEQVDKHFLEVKYLQNPVTNIMDFTVEK